MSPPLSAVSYFPLLIVSVTFFVNSILSPLSLLVFFPGPPPPPTINPPRLGYRLTLLPFRPLPLLPGDPPFSVLPCLTLSDPSRPCFFSQRCLPVASHRFFFSPRPPSLPRYSHLGVFSPYLCDFIPVLSPSSCSLRPRIVLGTREHP